MRAILYTRVSSDKAKGRSVIEQEQECRAECDRRGWTVAEVLCDNSRSATRFATQGRPEYQRLQQILRKGDVLVTWEASRAQRDLKAYVALRDLCAGRGVMWSYSGALLICPRLMTGSERAWMPCDPRTRPRKRGSGSYGLTGPIWTPAGPMGSAPSGTASSRDPNTGKPVKRIPDEVEAPILQDAARRVLAGESLRSVVALLNQSSTARKVRRPNNLRRMLASPVYAGHRTHKGEAVREGTWPPLLTADEHSRLVALFDNRVVSRGSAPKHLLSGIAECAVCGGRLYVRSSGYGCDHGHVGRDEAKVDRAVTEVIAALLSDPVSLSKLAAPFPPGHQHHPRRRWRKAPTEAPETMLRRV